MTWMQRFWPLMLGLFSCLLLPGCGSRADSPPPVSPLNLVPYFTPTPEFIPTATLPATEIPSPTPTPQIYTLVAGDTLSKLALRFGVSLESLQAANPGVQPSALTVGQTLVIPSAAGSNLPETFLPTPVGLEIGPVSCFSTVGGLSCLAPVHNLNPEAVENVLAQIILLDENGQTVQSQAALLPLNILPAGETLPAYAYFPQTDLLPALAQLTASLRLSPGDQRYLQTQLDNLLISLAWDGRSAQVEGQILLPAGSPPAKGLWLVATAYDAAGQIVGFRRWEWAGVLSAGQAQPFSLRVYSLGPEIGRVEVQVEARP